MKNLSFAVLLFLGIALAPVAASAERVYRDQEYLAFVAKAGAPETVNWNALRALYVETSFYNPYGGAQQIWYSQLRLAQELVDDPSDARKKAYKDMLQKHFAHYRSHLQAFDFAGKGGETVVDKSYQENALRGILGAIRSTGDGMSPETAFRVIDPAEEQMILRTFHYTSSGQDYRQKDGHFWDVLKYKNPQTNANGEMYFNVDTILMAASKG